MAYEGTVYYTNAAVQANYDANTKEIKDPAGCCQKRATDFATLVRARICPAPGFVSPYPPPTKALVVSPPPPVIITRAQVEARSKQLAAYQQLKYQWPFWVGAGAGAVALLVLVANRR